jgi:5-methyltetrahydrofolate--homocysteine methyltransferase
MGTELMAAGLERGACGEHWNLIHPERVLGIQKRYVEAGADCLLTNTFGANPCVLNGHQLSDLTVEINRAAVQIARTAFGDRPGFVLGDVGPLGALLEPYGDLTETEASDAFLEQATALVEAGADALIIETQTSLEELALAIQAAKQVRAKCVIASLAYDLGVNGTYRTMMGVAPADAARRAEQLGADFIALNCGTGMDMPGAAKVAAEYRAACSLPIMVQPNGGQPILENGKLVYRQKPVDMAAGVGAVLAAGARIIGSCCGSTPDHTRAIRAAVPSV